SLTDCTVTGNTAADTGGGLYVNYGTTTLNNVTVSGNHAIARGGLCRNCAEGDLQLICCTFSAGTASAASGGLLAVRDGEISLSNCPLSGNSASEGGGMSVSTFNVTLTNCTINNNSASTGGGLLNQGGALVLVNTIVVGNGNDNIAGGYTDNGGNL